jgi:lysophospholipase L1-like esterase
MQCVTRSWLCRLAWIAVFLSPAAVRADAFRLADGDRVAWVGNTLIEREQQYGYWETALTRRFPDRNITFRNLGWSGDTVFGHARAGFDSTADGFRRLTEHVLALRPTLLFIAYGGNDAFEGEAGLPHFREGLRALLDSFAATRARVVILSPLPHEDLGRPLPDPAEYNAHLLHYRDALREEADRRGYSFVDLGQLLKSVSTKTADPLTDNGVHLTAYGYWRSAAELENSLGLAPSPWHIEIAADGKPSAAQGVQVTQVQTAPLRFHTRDDVLPAPLPPASTTTRPTSCASPRVLRVPGLAAGNYGLQIDGKRVVQAGAAEWAAGVPIKTGPEFDQVERLREVIKAKNRLYFYRWRPQNETYLFGFRKYEQGQNAREIPQFDPLVAEREVEIARLRVPVTHTYQLVPETK